MANKLIPIILSQALDPSAEVKRTSIHHGLMHGGKISVYIPNDASPNIKEIPLPTAPFLLRHLGSADHSAWKFVIMWLQEEFVEHPLIIFDHDHPLRELMVFADAWTNLPYGLRFATPIPTVRVVEYALLSNSKINLFTAPEIEADFREKYIGPYRSANSESDLLSQVEEISQRLVKKKARPSASGSLPTAQASNGDDPIKLLVISYYSGPCRAVAVQRINYWFDEISEISGGEIETHLATAIDWSEERENLHVVPDHNTASLLSSEGKLPQWSSEFIATEQRNAKSFNTLSYYWRYALEQYFDARDLHFDAVVISGNPFACFDFAAYAKQRWHARIILDYRDPFANNPRILYEPEARDLARYVETGYMFQSDAVLAVNNHCVDLLEAREDVNAVVVPNGFDERILNAVKSKTLTEGVINFVHAGAFYHDRSPKNILSSMDSNNHRFHHVGSVSGIESDLVDHEAFVEHGRKSYTDTLEVVGGADCGVVFLSETNFETTTKIFDYLAMGIDILLCTQGELRSGALNDILAGHKRVFWCQNTDAGVANFLKSYRPRRRKGKDARATERFSRHHSTKILVEKIYELVRN